MKIGIYAIAKNESKNLDGWFKNISNADYVLILDTGSVDNTVEKARSLGINVFEAHLSPWDEARAKNIAMSLLPKDLDFCISLDLDEHVSTPEWRDSFFDSMQPGIYLTSSIGLDGINKFDRLVRNVHPRSGYYWKNFRSEITPYPKYTNLAKDPLLAIKTDAVSGNQERYSHNDPLYVQSFLNQVLMLEEERKNNGIKKQLALAHLALSYYEIEDYSSFENMYMAFSRGASELSAGESEGRFSELLDYAMAMVSPELAEEKYRSWIWSSSTPTVPISRLIMFLTLTRRYDEAIQIWEDHRGRLESETDKDNSEDRTDTKFFFSDIVFRAINSCLEFCKDRNISENGLEDIISVYSHIGWGKPHKDLALKAIDYGKL